MTRLGPILLPPSIVIWNSCARLLPPSRILNLSWCYLCYSPTPVSSSRSVTLPSPPYLSRCLQPRYRRVEYWVLLRRLWATPTWGKRPGCSTKTGQNENDAILTDIHPAWLFAINSNIFLLLDLHNNRSSQVGTTKLLNRVCPGKKQVDMHWEWGWARDVEWEAGVFARKRDWARIRRWWARFSKWTNLNRERDSMPNADGLAIGSIQMSGESASGNKRNMLSAKFNKFKARRLRSV